MNSIDRTKLQSQLFDLFEEFDCEIPVADYVRIANDIEKAIVENPIEADFWDLVL